VINDWQEQLASGNQQAPTATDDTRYVTGNSDEQQLTGDKKSDQRVTRNQ